MQANNLKYKAHRNSSDIFYGHNLNGIELLTNFGEVF